MYEAHGSEVTHAWTQQAFQAVRLIFLAKTIHSLLWFVYFQMTTPELFLVFEYLQALLRRFTSPKILDDLVKGRRDRQQHFDNVVPLRPVADSWSVRPPSSSAAAAAAAVASMSEEQDEEMNEEEDPTPVEPLPPMQSNGPAPAAAPPPEGKKGKKKGKVTLFQMGINRSHQK